MGLCCDLCRWQFKLFGVSTNNKQRILKPYVSTLFKEIYTVIKMTMKSV